MINLEFYGMFDYVEGDNDTYEYTSQEFASLIKGLTGNGVSRSVYNEFEITNSGLELSINSGAAYIEGYWCYNSTPVSVSLDATSSTTRRYDRVILTLDISNRTIGFEVLKGTPTTGTPVKPAIVNTDIKKSIPLYSCLVVNGSSVSLEDERIFTYAAEVIQTEIANIKAEKANVQHTHSNSDITGTISVQHGGTGSNTKAGALENLGAAAAEHTHTGQDLIGTVPVNKGGTGATTAADALANIGAAAVAHTHDLSTLGIIYSPTEPEVINGGLWLKPVS